MPEVDLDFGVLGLQYVESGNGEDGAGYNNPRRGADGLDDDVLRQCILRQEGTEAPTAMMEMGMAASNTCPILSPE